MVLPLSQMNGSKRESQCTPYHVLCSLANGYNSTQSSCEAGSLLAQFCKIYGVPSDHDHPCRLQETSASLAQSFSDFVNPIQPLIRPEVRKLRTRSYAHRILIAPVN